MAKKSSILRRALKRGHVGNNPDYLAGCYGKVRRQKKEAQQYAQNLINAHSYKCNFCSYWHVGRKRKKIV